MSDSVIPWTAARQASRSFTISLSMLKLMSIESVMPSNHLSLCRPLPLLKRKKDLQIFSQAQCILILNLPSPVSFLPNLLFPIPWVWFLQHDQLVSTPFRLLHPQSVTPIGTTRPRNKLGEGCLFPGGQEGDRPCDSFIILVTYAYDIEMVASDFQGNASVVPGRSSHWIWT